ncbi:MAG: hypothetical protein Fur0025_19190 [Oscillatoriaceae cyanobacterium]
MIAPTVEAAELWQPRNCTKDDPGLDITYRRNPVDRTRDKGQMTTDTIPYRKYPKILPLPNLRLFSIEF